MGKAAKTKIAKSAMGGNKSNPKAGPLSASPPSAQSSKPCVVGIGASAGGFEATGAFLAAIPRGAGLAFVVVQHMDPHHKSLATDLFARRTPHRGDGDRWHAHRARPCVHDSLRLRRDA